jgi:uncharacterized phage protein gp47/JayE
MSIAQVYLELKNKLLSVRSDIAVNPGGVISDTFITPSSFIINKQRVELSYAKALQTLFTIELLLDDEDALQEIATAELKNTDDILEDISNFINKIGANYGLVRYPATTATGIVYMGRNELLKSNITIPSGNIVKTLDNKEYTVSDTVIMVSPGSGYYDIDTHRYIIAVNIEANEAGTIGNTSSGTIVRFVNSVSGLNYITNKDGITSGQDEESDTDFIARIKNKLSGNTFGALDGYKSLIMDNFRTIKDVEVIPAGDSLMLRDNGSGGMVDIYVLTDDASVAVTSSFGSTNTIDDGTGYRGTFLPLEPVDENITPTAPATGFLYKDTGELVGSYAEKSIVYFTSAPSGTFNVTYNYFAIIKQIQDFIKTSTYAILGNTIKKINVVEDIALIKMAIKKLVNVSATINILPGFDSATIILNCQNNINDFVADLGLGDNLAQSDIVGILENTEGVDNVNLPLNIFNFVGETAAEIDDLIVAKNEYIRLETGSPQIIV